MACQYCDEGMPFILKSYVELSITNENNMKLSRFSPFDGRFLGEDHVRVKYCPMCGEKLGGDA